MTNEDKNLLFKDLCARLPYQPFIRSKGEPHLQKLIGFVPDIEHYNIKPYLRPMSSMTEEEMENLEKYLGKKYDFRFTETESFIYIDWLNAHHFDYRGLIEKSLAIIAPEEMYK